MDLSPNHLHNSTPGNFLQVCLFWALPWILFELFQK
jgi:hypothetical protein